MYKKLIVLLLILSIFFSINVISASNVTDDCYINENDIVGIDINSEDNYMIDEDNKLSESPDNDFISGVCPIIDFLI